MKDATAKKVLLGLGTGTAFGFLLQKGGMAKTESMDEQLCLCDWAVLETMGTAVAVGAGGTHLLQKLGATELKIKPLKTGGVLLGSALFGTGMAVAGYCPGTSLAGVGEGHKVAIATVLGMFGGACAYVTLYPKIKPVIDKGDLGERTLPEMTRTSPWWWAGGALLAVAGGAAARRAFEKRRT